MSKEIAIDAAIERTKNEIRRQSEKLTRLQNGKADYFDICPIEIPQECLLYRNGEKIGAGVFIGFKKNGDMNFMLSNLKGLVDDVDFNFDTIIRSGKFPYLPI